MQPVTTTVKSLFDTKIWVHNELRNKPLYVTVSPNPDYHLAEIYIGIASLVAGGIGIINSTSSFFTLLRTLSFMRGGASLRDKIRDELPRSSFRIPPGQSLDVHAILTSDFLGNILSRPFSTIAGLFGKKTVTLIITDESLEHVVMFNASSLNEYFADRFGVREGRYSRVDTGLNRWNTGGLPVGVNSSAPPSLVQMNGHLWLFYLSNPGKGIMFLPFEVDEGKFPPHLRIRTNQDSSAGVALTVLQDTLCVVGRHSIGEQMFGLWDPRRTIPDETSIDRGTYRWLHVDIDGRPSATTLGDIVYIVAAEVRRALGVKSATIAWAKFRADGKLLGVSPVGLRCLYEPAIHAYKGKFVMVYVNHMSNALCLANSTDGEKWTVVHSNGFGILGQPATSAGVALTVYKDRLYVFYRDATGAAIYYLWTEDGVNFKWPRNIKFPHASYFGLNLLGAPTASPMPGENNGIMVAGIRSAGTNFLDVENDSVEMVYEVLIPYEPGDEDKDPSYLGDEDGRPR
jgi:hypothetical protein